MSKKILLSISCLFLFTLMSWAGAVRAENKFYLGLGVHSNTFDLGPGLTVSELGIGEGSEPFFEESVVTLPLILGIMVDWKIPTAFEFQRHSGTGRKKFVVVGSMLGSLNYESVAEYGLTLLEVQPHLALSKKLNAFLIIGRGQLDVTLSGTVTVSGRRIATDPVSASGAALYFGGGLQFKTSEKWSWRLEARSMSFPVEGGGDIKNTNVGLSGLYTF